MKKIYREYSKADPEQLVRRNKTNHLNLPFCAWVVGKDYNPEQMSAQIRKAPYHVQVIYVAKPMDSCDDDCPCFVKLMSMAEEESQRKKDDVPEDNKKAVFALGRRTWKDQQARKDRTSAKTD